MNFIQLTNVQGDKPVAINLDLVTEFVGLANGNTRFQQAVYDGEQQAFLQVRESYADIVAYINRKVDGVYNAAAQIAADRASEVAEAEAVSA